MSVKKKLKGFILSFFLGSVSILQAWDQQGHILISEIAEQSIQPKTREFLKGLFFKSRGPRHLSYRGALPVWVKQSAFPDRWRRGSARDVFRQHGAKLPFQLQQEALRSTASWHYWDQPYYQDPKTTSCVLRQDRSPHWDRVIPALKAAWVQDNLSLKTQKMVLLFLIHLIADAHQPLHAFSLVQSNCELDAGGNGFCLKKSAMLEQKCTFNLHQYWDKGLRLKRKSDLKKEAQSILIQYPRTYFSESIIRESDPTVWARESFSMRSRIYDLKRNSWPSDSYEAYQRSEVRRLFALAGYRLAWNLDQLILNSGS